MLPRFNFTRPEVAELIRLERLARHQLRVLHATFSADYQDQQEHARTRLRLLRRELRLRLGYSWRLRAAILWWGALRST